MILDRGDRRILSLLQRDCLVPAELIAEKTGMSASSVLRRIRKMREEGVIQGQVTVVDAKKVGVPLTFVTALEIERERKDLLSQLRKWLDREDSVQQAIYTTGSADVYLIILARDVESYDAITQRLVEENPNIRRLTTSVALQTYKRGIFVPTEDESF
ncbi:AsnC family transcriptional regulator [Pseudomonas laurylsulfativorans]|uniref:AsnC family transcriptional regulator n=2 Tax=Pseudomonas laurylsulfativorans TaxID=1943631 RepID=A0A2S3VWQ9_9PSED|nr:AsnC family transcriptional regulator [Pseudomonas laurylsulfativorans]